MLVWVEVWVFVEVWVEVWVLHRGSTAQPWSAVFLGEDQLFVSEGLKNMEVMTSQQQWGAGPQRHVTD